MRALLTRLILAVVLTVSGFAATGAPFAAQTFQGISDPRSYAGLQVWYDASDVSSMRNNAGAVPSTGEGIKLWADKSGNSSVNALVGNGQASNERASLTTGTAIGTGDVTLVSSFIAQTQVAAFACSAFLASGTTTHVVARSLSIRQDAGSLLVLLFGATTSDFNVWTYAGFLTAYTGQTVTVAAVRNGSGNPNIYINGTDVTASGSFTTGGTPPTWQGTITSTNCVIGGGTATVSWTGPVFSTRAYSSALNAAAVLADYNGTVQANNFVNCPFASVAKLTTSFTCASGQTVTVTSSGALGCRISGARDLYQGTAANQPILTIAAAGNYLTFDGSNDYLKAAAFALAQPTTVYGAINQLTWTLSDYIFDGNTPSTLGVLQSNVTPQFFLRASGSAAIQNGNLAVATNGIITAVFNGASSLSRVNRTAAVTGDPGSTAANGFTLGARGDGAASWANITASEVLVYSTADATAQQNAVIGYLARKWSISGGFAHMPPPNVIPFEPNIAPWKREDELIAA